MTLRMWTCKHCHNALEWDDEERCFFDQYGNQYCNSNGLSHHIPVRKNYV